jgi:hypothetical protein
MAADVDAAVGQDARAALGRGAKLQVVADGPQDDVAREAMASHQTSRLVGRVSATRTARANHAAALIVIVADQA